MIRRTRPTRTPARRAFTLIELIIVIVIILILVGLSTSAVLKMIGLQQRRNTEQTVIKVDKNIRQQWAASLDTAKTEQVHAIAVHLSGPSPGDSRRARVIHTLLCLRREFPMSFTEAGNPVPVAPADLVTLSAITPGLAAGGFGPNKAYVTALKNSANRSPERESSGCVYLALKQTRRGMNFDPDTAFSSQELVDPAKDGVKEIYDAWSSPDDPRPIFLLRWPYSTNAPYPAPPFFQSSVGTIQPYTSQANPPDPADPEGLLANPGWQQWLTTPAMWMQPNGQPYTAPQQQAMQRLIAAVFWWQGQPVPQSQWPYPLAGATAGKPNQYQLTPVIMSKGANGTFPDKDDIYNFQLSSLGGSR